MAKRVTEEDVNALVEVMKQNIKGFEICWKADSWLQRLIGKILSPFNDGYLSGYATTMFGKLYLPEAAKNWSPATKYKLYRHEFVHLLDNKRFSVIFGMTYLLFLPVILTMRAYWELRGYTQSFIVFYEVDGDITDNDIEWAADQFTSSKYLWMWPFRTSIRNKLWAAKVNIKAGNYKGMYPYNIELPRLKE